MKRMSSFPFRCGLVTGGFIAALSIVFMSFLPTLPSHSLVIHVLTPPLFPIFITLFAMGMADYPVMPTLVVTGAVAILWSCAWFVAGCLWGLFYQSLKRLGRRILAIGTGMLVAGFLVLWIWNSVWWIVMLRGLS